MPNFAKHYMISPFDDVNGLMDAAVKVGTHRLSKNKLAIQPVFKDDSQREAFNQMAKDLLAGIGERTTSNQHQFDTLTYLEDRSRRKAPYSWTDFTRVENPSPRVYVVGHGAPGLLQLTSNTGEWVSAEEVAALLSSMKVPQTSDVRADSCSSGAGQHYPGDAADWYKRFHEDTLAEVSDPNGGFAAELQRQLTKKGFQGAVHGYLIPVADRPRNVLVRGGAMERHMGATKVVFGNAGPRIVSMVRKRDVRVRVPAPMATWV